jgi:uncharacterized membrane protein
MPLSKQLRTAGLALVFVFFLLGGIAHFAFAEAEISIIPPWVAFPRVVNYVVGVLELLGAFGVLIPFSRRAAGLGLIVLTIAVTPANVFMLQHSQRYPDIALWLLVARLPAQLLLIVLIAWSSRVWRGAVTASEPPPAR